MTEQRRDRSVNLGRAWRRRMYRADFLSGEFPMLRSVSTYAAIAIFGTTLFFFLHWLGNQIPYDLAKQRFATALSSEPPDEGYALGFKSRFTYCQLSLTVLAGAGETHGPLLDAIQLWSFPLMGTDYCDGLRAVVGGADLEKRHLKTRYWWGNKALYALALRYLSVFEIRELIRISTYVAYGLLAASLLLLSPRTLLITAPLLVFGAFFSGVRYWADVENGIPYLWTVLSVAILALLMFGRSSWASLGVARISCFIMGMVSSYLWLGDGHTFLAITWVGLMLYFGRSHLNAPERTKRAISGIVLYLVGFATCYALGQLVKFVVLGSRIWGTFWGKVIVVFDRTIGQERAPEFEELPRQFSLMTVGETYVSTGEVLIFFSLFVLTGSMLFAAFQAYRGRFDLPQDIFWVVGLMLLNVPNFVIAEDSPFRTARFMFIPYALCLSCLILTVMKMNRRHSLIFGVLLAGGVGFWFSRSFQSLDKYNREISALIENTQPVVHSHFDVYLHGSRLIYARSQCTDHDIIPRFFLHVIPVDEKDLPDHGRQYGYDNLDFYFIEFRSPGFQDETCVAVRPLPDYDIASIRTGQSLLHDRKRSLWKKLWEARFQLGDMTEG